MSNVKFVVGLGNSDGKYRDTYHNIGFQAVDTLISEESAHSIDHNPGRVYKSDSASVHYFGKPNTFVNKSGSILEKWADDFQLSPDEFLIVYDDFSLDRGSIRIRPSGSPGGHNGMKDIINRLGTSNIPRIRIGIGPVPTNEKPSDFVLSSIHPDDRPIFKRVLSEIPEIIETISDDGIEESMNRWNGVNFNERVG